MQFETVGQLKEFLKDVPDDVKIKGYDGGDSEPPVMGYLDSEFQKIPEDEKDELTISLR